MKITNIIEEAHSQTTGEYIAVFADGKIKKITIDEIKELAQQPQLTDVIKEQVDNILFWFEQREKKAKQDEENRDYCQSIADKLHNIAVGLYHICPECGEFIDLDECEDVEKDGETLKTCSCCNVTLDPNEAEQASLYNYFDDVFDIKYITDYKKEYIAVIACVAWGGPAIYVDTHKEVVRLHWWGDYADYPLSYEAINAIDEYFEDYFNCI